MLILMQCEVVEKYADIRLTSVNHTFSMMLIWICGLALNERFLIASLRFNNYQSVWMLVVDLVQSWLYYRKNVLVGLPTYIVRRVQSVQNPAD